MSFIVILCVTPTLIQQMLSIPLYCTFWLFCYIFRRLQWKATMVVICLKGSSPLFFVHFILFHEQLHHSCHPEWQRCLADTPRACGTQSVFKQLINRSWATARFSAVRQACDAADTISKSVKCSSSCE